MVRLGPPGRLLLGLPGRQVVGQPVAHLGLVSCRPVGRQWKSAPAPGWARWSPSHQAAGHTAPAAGRGRGRRLVGRGPRVASRHPAGQAGRL